MAIYYIDPDAGRPENDGLSPASPLATNIGLALRGGDKVLFKRGCVIRGQLGNVSGDEGDPITYGAYGEGELPAFCGSIDVSREEYWEKESGNKWRLVYPLKNQVCNFDADGEGCAFKWTEADLRDTGDFWDEAFGMEEAPRGHRVLFVCPDNPARYYRHIECMMYDMRCFATTGHDQVIEDIRFYNNGLHALCNGRMGSTDDKGRNMVIRRCRFERIGGLVYSLKDRIRFGNAIQYWVAAENILIEDCVFDDIFDSAVTHQGPPDTCLKPVNFVIRRNLFSRCGMAAYEQRDRLPSPGSFEDNVCVAAGEGFSHKGIEGVRGSEIWPRPMGHHVFLWRMDRPEDEPDFSIRNNVFLDAPAGGAIYSVMAPEADAQIKVEGNTYAMRKKTVLCRMDGVDYPDFEAWQETGRDRTGKGLA